MKKSALLFLAAGLVGGFAIGHGSKSNTKPIAQPSAPAPESESPADSESPNQERARERELLLLAIDELDLTTAELVEAQEYIHKLERNTKRYNWLVDYWKEKGFGTSHRMSFRSHNQFKPSDDLVGFFGWDEEQVAQLAQAGKEVDAAIKAIESEQAVCIEDSDKKLVYEIPAVPEELKKRYMQSMEAILGPDDMVLLSSNLEKQFEPSSAKRTLTLTIGPPPDHISMHNTVVPDQEWMKVMVEHKTGESSPFGGGTSTSFQSYTPGKTISFNWNHVFKMEGPEISPIF